MKSSRFLLIAVWFGLITGAAEMALLGIKKFYLGRIIRVGSDFVWMAPLAGVILFLVPAGIFAVLALWRPNLRLFKAALAVFAFLCVLSVLLHYSRLELYAKALIAAGIAVQAARFIAPRAQGFHLVVRRTLPWMVGIVVVLAAVLYGSRWFGFRQAVDRLPQSAARAPNVLLIVLDTVRARSLSLYGYNRQTTPNLDRLAKSAAVFERAIAPSPWTFPSHATMFTGRWPHELSADWHTPLDARYPTLAEVLRDKGYLTAGFAANIFYCTSEYGMDRGFLHYEDYPVSMSQLVMSSSIGRDLISFSLNRDFSFRFRQWIGYTEIPGRRSAEQINGAFLSWLARQDTERPFFAFLNYLDAHQPFLPPSPFDVKFLGDTPRGDPRHWWDREWSPQEIQVETDSYDGAIAYLDHQVELLFEKLRQVGQLDNTLVIITSDHGEHLGEHGFMRHSNTLYLEVLHVPLMIRFPEQVPSVTVHERVTLRDIPATVLALLNLECEGCFPGLSLTRHWMNQNGTRGASSPSPMFSEVRQGIRIPDRYPSAKGDMKSLIADDLHYIMNGDGGEELYDLAKNPGESENIVRSIDGAAARNRLRSRLEAIIQSGLSSGPERPRSAQR